MAWEVEFTNEFEAWWVELDESSQVAIDAVVRLLEARGPVALLFPTVQKLMAHVIPI